MSLRVKLFPEVIYFVYPVLRYGVNLFPVALFYSIQFIYARISLVCRRTGGDVFKGICLFEKKRGEKIVDEDKADDNGNYEKK